MFLQERHFGNSKITFKLYQNLLNLATAELVSASSVETLAYLLGTTFNTDIKAFGCVPEPYDSAWIAPSLPHLTFLKFPMDHRPAEYYVSSSESRVRQR